MLYKRILVKEIPIFDKVCMQYVFKNKAVDEEDYTTLIFVNKQQIFSLNYEKETM